MLIECYKFWDSRTYYCTIRKDLDNKKKLELEKLWIQKKYRGLRVLFNENYFIIKEVR